ncbi:MAG: hypothetical protein QXO54_06040 [Candidatus Methanomethylicaceae archaeon]
MPENPMIDGISTCRIRMRGWDRPELSVEMRSILVCMPVSSIFGAGSPQPLGAVRFKGLV